MKKVLIIAALALVSIGASAQGGLKFGLNLGLPVGDAGDISSFSVGLDAYYMFSDAEDINFGFAAGFTSAFGKSIDLGGLGSIDIPDVQFLPIAGAARFSASESVSIGADLGYALGINDGNDGGFYYRPIVGFGISDNVEINGSYTGISLDGGSWSTINVGVLFAL